MNPVKRILVVDDDPTILFLLKQLLAAEGYEVVTASDGDEAQRLSRSRWFDLFLVDLVMPRKDGFETILSLRKFWTNTPIIAMSGGWHGEKQGCLSVAGKLGACGTLAKPFNQDALLGTVRSNLESRPLKPYHKFLRKTPPRIFLRFHWRLEVIVKKARRRSNQIMASREFRRSTDGGSCDRDASQSRMSASLDGQHKNGIAIARCLSLRRLSRRIAGAGRP